MKNKLKQITDLTINEVLQKDIIMPSSYFESFDKNAKSLEVDFNKNNTLFKTNELIANEFNVIHNYLQTTVNSIDLIQDISKKTKEAIVKDDKLELEKLNLKLIEVQKELDKIKEEIFTDQETNTFNKKWIYKELINNESKMNHSASIIMFEIKNYEYLISVYNSAVANNLLRYVIKFTQKMLKDENLNCKFIRYFENTFLISFNTKDYDDFYNLFLNIKNILNEKTLKSKEGIIVDPNVSFTTKKYQKNDDFFDILENLNLKT